MKLLVFGNIGAGKTTFLDELSEVVPWQRIAIDDCRRQRGDGSSEGEQQSRRQFYEALDSTRNQFVECLGVGAVAEELWSLLGETKETVVCLTLLVPKTLCKERLVTRLWDIPFPVPLSEVDSVIDRTDERIANGAIEARWSERPNTTLVSGVNVCAADRAELVNRVAEILRRSGEGRQVPIDEIDLMLSESMQGYYASQYLSYQSAIVEKNATYRADRSMVETLIACAGVTGNVLDVGSGNCQWFGAFRDTIDHYYAVEVNQMALSLSPNDEKLVRINRNVFDAAFEPAAVVPGSIDCVLLSFFLSHFADASIATIIAKLAGARMILIVDTLWSEKHKQKFPTKELQRVRRKTSTNTSILLPKRCFERSDIEQIAEVGGFEVTSFVSGNYWFVSVLIPVVREVMRA